MTRDRFSLIFSMLHSDNDTIYTSRGKKITIVCFKFDIVLTSLLKKLLSHIKLVKILPSMKLCVHSEIAYIFELI